MATLGEIVMAKGWASPQQMARALAESQRTGEPIGTVLVRARVLSNEQVLEALAEQFSLVFVPTLKERRVADAVIKAVPAKLVWHYRVMPLELTGHLLRIAVSDPRAGWLAEELTLSVGYDIERVLAPEPEILAAIQRYYGVGAETVEEILTRDDLTGKGHQELQVEAVEDVERSAQDASVIKLVNQILSEAVASRATDIHMEPYREAVRVRYRIDGILYERRVPEELRRLHAAIVSRIKIISRLNVIERRLPQDGRALIRLQQQQVDLRISIIPGLYGENVVIRILPVQMVFDLKDLGFLPEDRAMVETLMQRPHGIILVTGPTGSGKTTTLYAFLSHLNTESVKIITIEDPVEYELKDVMQLQVKPEIGLTFAAAFRSVLRHDPDIMMVGEIRDVETAELAIRTALTGHLIFSTLHTNDAASGATRLLDIGIEPYLVTSSVNAFISQRLVRMVCPACTVARPAAAQLPPCFQGIPLVQGQGCDACQSIGYKGRTALHEVLVVDDAIQALILARAPASQIKQQAKANGSRTLLDAGVEKVRQGLTTPEEVLRVAELGPAGPSPSP